MHEHDGLDHLGKPLDSLLLGKILVLLQVMAEIAVFEIFKDYALVIVIGEAEGLNQAAMGGGQPLVDLHLSNKLLPLEPLVMVACVWPWDFLDSVVTSWQALNSGSASAEYPQVLEPSISGRGLADYTAWDEEPFAYGEDVRFLS